MTENNKEEKMVTFDFHGTITLRVKDVFVDNDAPEKFTSEDVAVMIEGQYSNIGDFITDWGLGDNVFCDISTSQKDSRTLTL